MAKRTVGQEDLLSAPGLLFRVYTTPLPIDVCARAAGVSADAIPADNA